MKNILFNIYIRIKLNPHATLIHVFQHQFHLMPFYSFTIFRLIQHISCENIITRIERKKSIDYFEIQSWKRC